ncbi:MAG TPA: hypothetical protein VIG72_11190 [Pontibacter sp.]
MVIQDEKFVTSLLCKSNYNDGCNYRTIVYSYLKNYSLHFS